jgi:PAS domain S-box-containing protein
LVFNFPAYSIFFLTGFLVSVIVTIIVWKRRSAPGALPFALFILSGAIWSIAWMLELGSQEIGDKIIWAKMAYLGKSLSATLWLTFILEYSGYTWWRKPRNLCILAAIPLLTIFLVWTNEWHYWFWSNIYVVHTDAGKEIVWEYGPLFWTQLTYQYGILLTGAILLCRSGLHKSSVHRFQALTLTIGSLLPISSNLIYLLSSTMTGGLDYTPLALAVSGLIYAITINQYHFLDVVPVARDALVENMPDGILVLNAQGFVVDMNPAAEKMSGKQKTFAQGKSLESIWPELSQIISPEEAGRKTEFLSQTSASLQYLDAGITLLKDKAGRTSGTLIQLRDITESKQTHRKLENLYQEERQLRGSLQEEIENRTKYTRSLVHELRTPLTAILSSGELLQELLYEETESALIKNMMRASVNLEKRISDLIALASGEIGRLKIDTEPVDISVLIREMLETMTPAASDKGLVLVTDVPDNLPPVRGDENRLRDVLNNLVNNSIKFTKKGQVTISVKMRDAASLMVQVMDTGPGIEPDQLENIFDPYRRRLTEGQKFGGMGIGLALSKIFIELHRGKIWVESIPGRGATFNFTLPVIIDSLGKVKTEVAAFSKSAGRIS